MCIKEKGILIKNVSKSTISFSFYEYQINLCEKSESSSNKLFLICSYALKVDQSLKIDDRNICEAL